MSDAKKCDRCKTLFDPEEIDINFSDMRMRYYLIKDCYPYPEIKLDLCEKCRVDLYNWINRGANNG